MDKKFFIKLLREPKEQDWFDFKGKLKLYQSDGKLVDQQRDELIKDILGMANGNSHIIRNAKYLVIGADDEKVDENGLRILHNVDYKIPSQSDLAKWLSGACTPAVVGLECEDVLIQDVHLFVITIRPTFDLHETTRELNTPKSTFQKHTVFMRQDEHTIPASVRDGITIQRLKHLYRQEIANPSSVWLGIIVGGIVSLIIGVLKLDLSRADKPIPNAELQIIFVILGVFFGGTIGGISQQLNGIRFDWRYMSWKQRIPVLVLIFFIILVFFLIPRL
jgi:hypothetical protein